MEKEKVKESTKDTTKTNAEKTTADKSSTNNNQKKVATVIAIVAGILLIGLIAIGLMEGDSDSAQSETETEEITANCAAAECLKQIDNADSVEKITEVIGVEPEESESDGSYKWKTSSTESLTREKNGDSYSVKVTLDKEKLANDKVDFSVFSELQTALKSGESFTYEELVKKLNDVDGTLEVKGAQSKQYVWVDNNGQTFRATFSDKNGKCSIITLR